MLLWDQLKPGIWEVYAIKRFCSWADLGDSALRLMPP